MSMTGQEALDSPVYPEISDAVWQSVADQRERRARESGVKIRGEFRVSPTAGIQFVPEDSKDGDRIFELFGDRDWHIGIKGSVSL